MTEQDRPADHYILAADSVAGNSAVWWRPKGQGYTCNLDEAGLYTLEYASNLRETDVPVHKDDARRLAQAHVNIDHLWQSGALARGADGRTVAGSAKR